MAKRFYQVGEPCDVCGTPCIASKNPKPGGSQAYCWPCWSKWKDSQKAPQTAQQPQNTQSPTFPQMTQPASKSEATELLTEIRDLLRSIDKKILLRDPESGEIIPF